jgi:hypothetical protein
MKGSFWWRDILRLLPKFKELASVVVHLGDTCFLWQDYWGGSNRRQTLPQHYSFAKNKNISVSKALWASDINQLFHLPISQEAFEQLLLLAQDLETLQGDNQDDFWSYIWGSPQFFPTKAYQHLIGHRQVHPAFSTRNYLICDELSATFSENITKSTATTTYSCFLSRMCTHGY